MGSYPDLLQNESILHLIEMTVFRGTSWGFLADQ